VAADGEPAQIAPASVLDASALLALVHDEPGAEPVGEAIATRAAISIVNLAEVLSKLADAGADPEQARRELLAAADDQHALVVEPLTDADSVEVARLRPTTRALGLSLADRALLGVGRATRRPCADRRPHLGAGPPRGRGEPDPMARAAQSRKWLRT